MKFCTRCGAAMDDTAFVCPVWGKAAFVEVSPPPPRSRR